MSLNDAKNAIKNMTEILNIVNSQRKFEDQLSNILI
jgi:hypothetical protein